LKDAEKAVKKAEAEKKKAAGDADAANKKT